MGARGLAGFLIALCPVFAAHAQTPPVAVVAAIPTPVAPTDDAAAVQTLHTRLEGVYREAPGATNAANRDEGVQHSVDELFFAVRPIAFSRIVDGNPVFPLVRIAFHDGQISVQTPPVAAISPEDGTEALMTGLDHETNHVVQRLTTNSLIQRSWTEEGSRTTRFAVSPDGQTLTLHIQIRSPRLPVSVRYTMSYVRVAN